MDVVERIVDSVGMAVKAPFLVVEGTVDNYQAWQVVG